MGNGQSKRDRQLSFLRKIGFLIRYNDMELYHGRSQTTDDEWFVRNDVDNSFESNKNNIMAVPCLCVASYGIAESYARGTSLDGRTGSAKIHEIVSTDEDSLVINEKFNINKLSEGEAIKFFQAIQGMTSGVLKGYLSKDENALWILHEIREKYQDLTLISEAEEKSIYQMLMRKNPDISPELLGVVVGAINSNIYFQRAPIMMASNYLFDNPSQRRFLTAGGQKFRLNQEYIRQIFDKNNIIALKKKKFSGDNDDIVYIFNMSKVQTLEKLDTETAER